MSHYFEKTIVDAKDIYTTYLITTITPLLYEGFNSIYDKAKALEQSYIEGSKVDPNIKNPGILILFQHFLIGVDKLNDSLIEDETKRIRDNSRCSDIFDDLIKAVIKSHIIVLTYTASGKQCRIINEKLHEKVTANIFIHKCYIECARLFYDHVTLFWHEFPNNELKDNQRIIYQLIKIGIKNAIKRCLPMKEILEVYLNNDYIKSEEHDSEKEYMNVKDMINRDMNNKDNDEGGIMRILDSSESSLHDDMNNLEKNVEDIASLVFNRNVYDTLEGKTVASENNQEYIPVKNEEEKQEEKQEENKNNDDLLMKNEKINEPVIDEKKPDIFINQEQSEKKEIKKKKGQRDNILLDAINIARENIKEKKEHHNDDNINVIRSTGAVNNDDNYFDEIMN